MLQVTYTHGEKSLNLQPLKGQIDPDKSSYFVGKVKVEISLAKRAQGRWGDLVGDAPDRAFQISSTHPPPLHSHPLSHVIALANSSYNAPATTTSPPPRPRKNWEGISDEILKTEKEKSTDEDPNVGGDSTLNSFFQKIYADADEDTRRAMMKSFSESGGTTLSTNWDEVKKKPVDVKPPAGSEWKKWN